MTWFVHLSCDACARRRVYGMFVWICICGCVLAGWDIINGFWVQIWRSWQFFICSDIFLPPPLFSMFHNAKKITLQQNLPWLSKISPKPTILCAFLFVKSHVGLASISFRFFFAVVGPIHSCPHQEQEKQAHLLSPPRGSSMLQTDREWIRHVVNGSLIYVDKKQLCPLFHVCLDSW